MREEGETNHILLYLEQLKDTFSDISNFQARSPDASNKRISISAQIKQTHIELKEVFIKPMRLLRIEKTLETTKTGEINAKVEKILADITKSKEQVEQIVSNIQQASGQAGVSSFAGIFQAQSNLHQETAKNWFYAAGAAASALTGAVVYTSWHVTSDGAGTIGPYDFIQVLLSRLLLISVLGLIFFQIVKHYNNNMHLATLNKHRENSLLTFQSFVDATQDRQVKDAVLLQATKSIFDAGETGYVSTNAESSLNMETVKLTTPIQNNPT